MQPTLKKIKDFAMNTVKRCARKVDPINILTPKILRRLNLQDFKTPPFASYNERSVEYRFVFECMTHIKPKTILDVGTGLSALPSLMANCGARVTATDNVKDYWKKDLLNRHYLVLNDDITDTKLKGQFEMVTCISTLEHIEKYNQAVKNIFSLTAAGGHVVFTFPYNERKSVPNVYSLEGTSVKALPGHTTHAYSKKDLERWCVENDAKIIEQEYWQFFTGEYWTGGEMLPYPKKVSSDEKHQISCVLLQKNSKEV